MCIYIKPVVVDLYSRGRHTQLYAPGVRRCTQNCWKVSTGTLTRGARIASRIVIDKTQKKIQIKSFGNNNNCRCDTTDCGV